MRCEDYVVSDISTEKAIFSLSDGVGSSFYGDIGSQILSERVISWLKALPLPNLPSENGWLESLSNNLQNELNQVTGLATSIVQAKNIDGKDRLTRMAEAMQRDDFGTQANFVAGIIWPSSKHIPNGLIVLFWLGNARVRIFDNQKELTDKLAWGKDHIN